MTEMKRWQERLETVSEATALVEQGWTQMAMNRFKNMYWPKPPPTDPIVSDPRNYCFCANGALAAAYSTRVRRCEEYVNWAPPGDDWYSEELCKTIVEMGLDMPGGNVAESLKRDWPDGLDGLGRRRALRFAIATWNDQDYRTHEEVVSVFKGLEAKALAGMQGVTP